MSLLFLFFAFSAIIEKCFFSSTQTQFIESVSNNQSATFSTTQTTEIL